MHIRGKTVGALAVASLLLTAAACSGSSSDKGSAKESTAEFCAAAVPFYNGLPKTLRVLQTSNGSQNKKMIAELDGYGKKAAEAFPEDKQADFEKVQKALDADLALLQKEGVKKVKASQLKTVSDRTIAKTNSGLITYTSKRCAVNLFDNRQPASAKAKVLVIGDSVAISLTTLWQSSDSGGKLAVTGRGELGCGILYGQRVNGKKTTPMDDKCKAFPASWKFWSSEDKPDAVVLMLGAWDTYDIQADGTRLAVGGQKWKDEVAGVLNDFATWTSDQGIKLVLVQTPCFLPPSDGPGSKATGKTDPRLAPLRVTAVNKALAAAAKDHDNTSTVLLGPAFCKSKTGSDLRPDGTHFSLAGSTLAWKQLTPAVLKATGN